MKAPSPFNNITLNKIRSMTFTVSCCGKTFRFQPVTFGYEGIELEAMTTLHANGVFPPQNMQITVYDGKRPWIEWEEIYPEQTIYLGTTPLGNRVHFYPAEGRYGKTNDMPEW